MSVTQVNAVFMKMWGREYNSKCALHYEIIKSIYIYIYILKLDSELPVYVVINSVNIN